MRPQLTSTAALAAALALALVALAPTAGADVSDSHGGSNDGGRFSGWAYYANGLHGGSGRVEVDTCHLSKNPDAPAHLEYNVVMIGAGPSYVVFKDCVINGKHVDDSRLIYPAPGTEWDWLDTWFITPAPPQDLIAHAIAIVQPAAPPVTTDPGGGVHGLVNMPVYLKLTATPLDQLEAVVDPPLRVVVQAHPTSVDWNTGDGQPACNAPAPAGFACAHLFTRSSIDQPGQAYTITATIHYEGRYDVYLDGNPNPIAGDTVGIVDRTSTVPLPVNEAQALNNDG